ncbi:MAG: hypothetical protein KAX78_04710 [Phycisphaerae bacterium]|nr:hypothetical protein [Phycisphaerae bacterium]
MAPEVLNLSDLDEADVPAKLKAETYFDFKAHPFAHSALFGGANARSVIDAIAGVEQYLKTVVPDLIAKAEPVAKKTQADFPGRCAGKFTVLLEDGAVFDPGYIVGGKDESATLYLRRGAKALGANIWVDSGSIVIGEGVFIESGAGIKGLTIVGGDSEIRQGAYLRGNVITGAGCILGGELKNTVIMEKGNFPHTSYLGDSLCGCETHFGNQATSANLGILSVIERSPIVMEVDGRRYNLGRPKVGIIMGDYSQVGCNSVSDPGTFLAPWTVVYQLTRLNRGFYGPNELLKNKPMEHGIIERVPLRR